MNLGEYLHHSRITQKDFAEIVGVRGETPARANAN